MPAPSGNAVKDFPLFFWASWTIKTAKQGFENPKRATPLRIFVSEFQHCNPVAVESRQGRQPNAGDASHRTSFCCKSQVPEGRQQGSAHSLSSLPGLWNHNAPDPSALADGKEPPSLRD